MSLCYAPLTSQQMVIALFAGVIGSGFFVYLDNLIIISHDLDCHFQKLDLAFGKVSEAGVKVRLTKCNFFRSHIQFLGLLVNRNGIHTLDSQVKAVKNFPTSQYIENVCSFLDCARFYRTFAKDFASIASPSTRLPKEDVTFT